MSDTTRDAFLGGRLHIEQPVDGYRAGIDPVLLAASVPAKPGDAALELGTGSGVALLCLMARVAGLECVGVERDPRAVARAVRNAAGAGAAARIVEADITDLPEDLRDRSFDHVFANPPFFNRATGSAASHPEREAGRGQETPLKDWFDTATRRLKPGGMLTLIHRADSLPDLLSCLDGRTGDVMALPVAARIGRPAKLVILQARKGAKGPFRLGAPLIMHKGKAHLRDCDDYTPKVRDILRNGSFLDLNSFMNG